MRSARKIVRLDFSGAKGVVYLSSDYRIIDGDQGPASNKTGLPACSESAEPTLKSAEPIAACSELARPTASTAYPKSARLTSQSARPITLAALPASTQVGPPTSSWLSRLPLFLQLLRWF
jgi:hypothetical protein